MYSAAPNLKISPYLSLLSSSPLTLNSVYSMCFCVSLRVDLYNFGWQEPPVSDQRLEVLPTALTGLAELLTGLSLSLTLHRKRSRNHGAPTCNYPMEGNAPSLQLLWSPLKMPHRELVVIRTHDSLITPLRSSRNTAQGVDAAGGG